MDKSYNTTYEERSTTHSVSGRLYSKIRKALTLDEIRKKYSVKVEINKASA